MIGLPDSIRGGRLGWIGLLSLATLAWPMPARSQGAQAELERAEAAWAQRDLDEAARHYRLVLELEPQHSRAIFQLARLAPQGSRRALELYRRYTTLEPDDPWGWFALGEALAKSGRTDEAIAAFERGLTGAPGEAAAWRALAHERQRAGRLREAERALERALSLERDPATMRLLYWIRARMAPAIEPFGGSSRDSDGNLLLRAGVRIHEQTGDRLRMGFEGWRGWAKDGDSEINVDQLVFTVAWQPRRGLSLEASGGAARIAEPGDGSIDADQLLAIAQGRIRWKTPLDGAGGELRFQRQPLTTNPALLARHVTLTEVGTQMEARIAGPLRIRGLGRLGTFEAPSGTNRRLAYGGGLILRPLNAIELGALAHGVEYKDPTSEHYFAPTRADVFEATVAADVQTAGGASFALDLGGGVQRIREGKVESWRRALRVWSLGVLSLASNVDLRIEAEFYDTALADGPGPEVPDDEDAEAAGMLVDNPPHWRYGSSSLALRWHVDW